MRNRPKRDLGAMLVESMAQAVAIEEGRMAPARRHRRTLREAVVNPPPPYASMEIRRLRDHLGLSQPVFAQALNVSVGTIRSWEQGLRVPEGPSLRLLELAERHPKMILKAVQRVDGRRVLAPLA